MTSKKPTTIAEYIAQAPIEGQPHLQELYELLKSVAPKAEEAIKWGNPFFVEPRFLFAFSAHKAHMGFISSIEMLDPYREQLQGYEITPKGILKVPYKKPIPKSVIKTIAKAQLKKVTARDDDSFW